MSSARELGWPRRDVMVMIYEGMESKGRSEENDIACCCCLMKMID